MRNHVAVHLQKGEVVTGPMRGEAEPCSFCGCSTGTCTTSILRKKINSTCPCVVTLKQAVAMRKPNFMHLNHSLGYRLGFLSDCL